MNAASDLQQFLELRRPSRRIVAVEMAFVDMLDGDRAAALVFAQILYWFTSKGKKSKLTRIVDGRQWLAKDARGFWEETRTPERTLARVIERLKKLGLIDVRLMAFNKSKTRFIALNEAVFVAKLGHFLNNPTPFSDDRKGADSDADF